MGTKESNWTQTADFGPEPSLCGAMVFMNTCALLFGAVSIISYNPNAIIYNNSGYGLAGIGRNGKTLGLVLDVGMQWPGY